MRRQTYKLALGYLLLSQVFYVLSHSLVKFGTTRLPLPLLLMARFGISSVILFGINAGLAVYAIRGPSERHPPAPTLAPDDAGAPLRDSCAVVALPKPKKNSVDALYRNILTHHQLILRAILGLTAMSFYFYAIHIGPLGRGNLIFSLGVLWGYIFSIIGKQESLTWRTSWGMICTLLGLWLLFTVRGGNGNIYADLSALAGSICSGMVMVTIKSLRKKHSARTIITWFYGVGALLILPFVSLQNVTFTWPLIGLLLGIGVFGLLAQWIMTDAYKVLPGSVAGSMNLLGTTIMMVSGVLFFSEVLHRVEILGTVCIMVGLVAIVWPKEAH